jgi:hypothetical protein
MFQRFPQPFGQWLILDYPRLSTAISWCNHHMESMLNIIQDQWFLPYPFPYYDVYTRDGSDRITTGIPDLFGPGYQFRPKLLTRAIACVRAPILVSRTTSLRHPGPRSRMPVTSFTFFGPVYHWYPGPFSWHLWLSLAMTQYETL